LRRAKRPLAAPHLSAAQTWLAVAAAAIVYLIVLVAVLGGLLWAGGPDSFR
jgi:hypothetical protein